MTFLIPFLSEFGLKFQHVAITLSVLIRFGWFNLSMKLQTKLQSLGSQICKYHGVVGHFERPEYKSFSHSQYVQRRQAIYGGLSPKPFGYDAMNEYFQAI